MGIEIRYHTVNGVVKPYWVPVFDPVGADGLVGADARILELPYMDVDGIQTPYWSPDTNGDKYTDDFPSGPEEPTGYVAKYTSYLVDNFTLVTGDSVNVWADESVNSNDLTQATSANQPKLVEDFTVTQYTASNQPTLVDDAGTWKLDFDTNDYMEGLKPQSGDFTYVFRGLDYDNTGVTRFLTESNSLAEQFYFQQNSGGQWVCRDDGGGFHIITTPILVYSEIALKKEGAVLSLHGDGALVGNFSGDVTGDTFNILRIGNNTNSINGSLQGLEIYDVAVADVTNITETPVQTLTADPLKMRTSANVNPTDGQDVAKWYADEFSAYRDARVVFDGNDYMDGLPPQAGDFTYVLTGVDVPNYDSINSRFIGQLTSNTARFINLSGSFRINDDADNIVFFEPWNNESVIVVRLSGSTLSVFMDGTQLGSDTDVTGSTFTTLTTLGNNTSSLNGETATINVFDRALTQTEIDYYSYLRSETGDILLPPLLPIATVNSMGLLNTADYALGTKSVPLQTESNQTWSMRVFVPSSAPPQNHLVFALNRLAPVARTSRITLTLLGPTTLSVDYYNHPTVGSNTNNRSITSSPINKDEWNHILVTMDVTGTGLATLYVNNVQQGTADVSFGIGNDPLLALGIGTYHSSFGSDLNGYINNLRIWDRALTSAEVATEWNNSASEFLCYDNAVSGSILSADLIDNSLTDDSGNSTITAVGTPTYTDQGMIKLC